MSRAVPILCLANSRKHGGRCIAGLRLDTGGWIRPVSDASGGGLQPQEYQTTGGHDPQALESVRVHLQKSEPLPHQPENWIIGNEQWELLNRDITRQGMLVLNAAINPGPAILGNTSSSIAHSEFKASPTPNSLALVRPENPTYQRNRRPNSRSDQLRICFDLMGASYNLPVTDPLVERELQSRDDDQDLELQYDSDREVPLLTVSLGQPYDNGHDVRCYKLVAAVMMAPSRVIMADRWSS